MNREDVEKLSTAAKGKINLLNSNFGKYFMRAIMAGFFIDVAMITVTLLEMYFPRHSRNGENSLEPSCFPLRSC